MMTTKQIEKAVAEAEAKDKELWDNLRVVEKQAEDMVRGPRNAWHQQRQNLDLLRAALDRIHALESDEPCPACNIPASANLNAQPA